MSLKHTLFYSILLLSLICFEISAQGVTEFQQNYQLTIQSTKNTMRIDGILDEPIWASLKPISNFKKKYPNDIGEAKRQTEVLCTYDDKNLYFAFKAYDSGEAIIQSLKRDIGHDGSDGVGIVIDPLNQKTNGFYFVLSALNVQSEDQLTGASSNGLEWSWDTKWFSATKDYGSFWIGEIMIPFKSIRFNPTQKFWGINFVRMDAKNNEYSAWTKVPPNFKTYDLGYAGVLNWPNTPPITKNNLIVLPYVTGSANENREQLATTKGAAINTSGNAGFDAKVAVNSSLNLDLTVNPDFSQVEVDQQVSNLTRFDIFLPEKRNFFLENADLFANFGIPPVRPFYSRTIGLDKEGNRIPILFGARLSGNIGAGTRIGAMNMQTGRQGNYSPENFSAFTLHQRVLQRSEIKGYFLNRENFISEEEEKRNPLDRYGRNAGVAFEYSNASGSFSSWATYHHSFKANLTSENAYYEAGISSNTKHWSSVLELGNAGKNYYTDMGYVQRISNYDAIKDTTVRVGFKNMYANLTYTTLPPVGKIGKLQFQIEDFLVINPDNSFNENNASFSFSTDFKNTSSFKTSLTVNAVSLLYPISFTNGTPLPAKTYQYNQFGVFYMSDNRKELGWFAELSAGQFYNGHIQSAAGGITWRNQPYLNIRMRAELNSIKLPGSYGSTNLLLIAPRVEYNFSTQLFWTTFIQYNTQSNNFNINSRLQYRYKPMSDFFLVYTDNYFTDPLFKNKNRAIIFKFSYWFNL